MPPDLEMPIPKVLARLVAPPNFPRLTIERTARVTVTFMHSAELRWFSVALLLRLLAGYRFRSGAAQRRAQTNTSCSPEAKLLVSSFAAETLR